MAKKQPKTEIVNRRQEALSRKEAAEAKRIWMIAGSVAAVVMLILIVGLGYTYIYQPNQPLATVNGESISRNEYQNRVRYERFLLDEQATLIQLQFQNMAQSLGDSPELLESLQSQAEQQLSQIQSQRFMADRQGLDSLIEDRLVEQEATKRGITISDDELNEGYNRIAAARQGGFTEAAVEETVTARENATATAAAQPTATPTEPLSDTVEAETETTPPTPAPTATFNVISGEPLTQAAVEWEETLQTQAQMSPTEFRQLVKAALLREKLLESFTDEVPTMELQSSTRHILVETEEEALAAKARLEAGEDFAAVAAELSLDTASVVDGGELGFFPQGTMVAEFDDAAFNLPVGQVSDPVETQFGFHLIEVLAREEREMDEFNKQQAGYQAYSDWLNNAKATEVTETWVADDAPPESTQQNLP